MLKKKFLPLLLLTLLIPLSFVLLKSYFFRPKNTIQDLQNPEITPTDTNIVLPNNFPQDFPVFPGSSLVAAKSAKDKVEGISAIWETKEGVENVASFYEINFKNLNWNYEVSSQDINFTAFKIAKDNIQGFIGITKGKEDVVVITVALGIK